MKRYGHLFEQIVSFENLHAAARRAFRGKRCNPTVAPFFFAMERELLALHHELSTETYRPKPYGVFEIREPKIRQICSSNFRDRVVHHAICKILEPLIERKLIFDSYACRTGKGNHAAVARAKEFSRRNTYFLKCDIRKYFPTIDHAILKAQLGTFLKDPEVGALLNTIIDHQVPGCDPGKGLPIGNLTSQYFANLYLSRLDHFLKDGLRIKHYIRYMDDFLVFGNGKDALWQVFDDIETFLTENLALDLKEKATRVAPVAEGIPFLGFRVFPGVVRLQRPNLVRFRKKVKSREAAYLAGHISESELIQSVGSMIAFVNHANSRSLRRKELDRSMRLA